MGSLEDRIAIVTGAGQGIGRAISQRLALQGATIVVTDISEETARGTAADLGEQTGRDHLALATDVSDRDSVAAMVHTVMDRHGRIDVLVNNAGWDKAEPFVDSQPETWQRVVAINLFGVLNTCKAILPVMAEQGHGHVVNIGSDAGRVGSSGEAVYSAAKGGVIAFTKSVAREMARHHVNANCVCPGPTDTALFASFGGPKLREALTKAIPLKRLAQPEDVATAVAFFASDDASYLTGQTLSVSGGLSMS